MIYYLSLGANIGKREHTLQSAIHLIEQQIGHVLRCSSFYYSEPWGFESHNPFCNLCCAIQTTKEPIEVLHSTQAIERALGRTKKSSISNIQSSIPNYSDRSIDIDLIRAFKEDGEEIYVTLPELHIPHLLWQERDFVKVPLAEIMQ